MKPRLREACDFFHEGMAALAEVEAAGMKIDTEYLTRTIHSLRKEIAEAEARLREDIVWEKTWKKRYKNNASLWSPQQLGPVLQDLGHKLTEFTEKSKQPKTDEHSLRNIDEPFLKDYFKTKKLYTPLNKLLGIERETDENGYLHPSYNLSGGISGEEDDKGGAKSYRGSCQMPNAQNFPIRNPEMEKLVRQAIIGAGRVVERDLSGIEVRIACCLTGDPQLIKEFTRPGGDPHGVTAAQLLMIPYEQVDRKTTRDSAKNQFVFPEFYGSVYYQCAEDIWEAMERRHFTLKDSKRTIREHLAKKGITELGDCSPRAKVKPGTFVHHVKSVEDDFWNNRFKVYTQWKKDLYRKYLERGYVDLVTGFRCEGYYRRNQVLNLPIQGPAFHCLLWILIQTVKALRKYKMKSRVIGQIHDSKLGDVPDRELQDYLDITEEITTVKLPKAFKWITVPIASEVDVSPIGGSWYAKQPWKRAKSGLWQPDAA